MIPREEDVEIRLECIEEGRHYDRNHPGCFGCEHLNKQERHHHCDLILMEFGVEFGGLTQEEVAEFLGLTVREVADEEERGLRKYKDRTDANGVLLNGWTPPPEPMEEENGQQKCVAIGEPNDKPRCAQRERVVHLPVVQDESQQLGLFGEAAA
jgi:hypothetical protein